MSARGRLVVLLAVMLAGIVVAITALVGLGARLVGPDGPTPSPSGSPSPAAAPTPGDGLAVLDRVPSPADGQAAATFGRLSDNERSSVRVVGRTTGVVVTLWRSDDGDICAGAGPIDAPRGPVVQCVAVSQFHRTGITVGLVGPSGQRQDFTWGPTARMLVQSSPSDDAPSPGSTSGSTSG